MRASIPQGALEMPLPESNHRQQGVAYCHSPCCVLSCESVVLPRTRGFMVRPLEDGLPEWQSAGLAVDIVEQSL